VSVSSVGMRKFTIQHLQGLLVEWILLN